MTVLEQVTTMKRQGISEGDIVNQLSQSGISPKEILDALRQAQIKSAVSSMETDEGMQPSVMPSGEEAPSPNQEYQPRVQEAQPEYAPQPQQEEYSYAPQQQGQYYQPSEGYAESAQAGADTDTIMEIADQVFSDKIKKVQKVLDATSEAAILLQTKFENLSDRLKKIESIIDKLQISILDKVGSYGQNLESIKKEMSMMSDSFSKVISHSHEKEKSSEEKKTHKK